MKLVYETPDGITAGKIKVSTEPSVGINSSEESRINGVTEIVAISRGKDSSNNPKSRYKKLLKEAAVDISVISLELFNELGANHIVGGRSKGPGRPLEYLPVILEMQIRITTDKQENGVILMDIEKTSADNRHVHYLTVLEAFDFLKHSTVEKIEDKEGDYFKVYTNARALLAVGVPYENIPFNSDEYTSLQENRYEVVKVKAPYFVFAQIRTHGQLSQVAVSDRVVDAKELWLPLDIIENIGDKSLSTFKEAEPEVTVMSIECQVTLEEKGLTVLDLVRIFETYEVTTVRTYLKLLGYHKEIYDRYPNHLYFKEWMIGGFLSDKKGWGHLLLEREAYPHIYSSWVQEDTRRTIEVIKQALLGDSNGK